MQVAEELRNSMKALRVLVHCGDGKFKAQLKKADASGARLALVLGEEEVANHAVGVKMLRESVDQITCSREKLVSYCQDYFMKESKVG